MKKENIAVIFGGRSTEHDVSIITAIAAVIKPLELANKYNVIPVYITKEGDWYSDAKLKDINFYTAADVNEQLSKMKKLQLLFDDGLSFVTGGLKTKKQKIDAVFPATHGTYGEDGSLMGLLRMANVPFVGCDMEASAISMNKLTSKSVVSAQAIPTTKMVAFTRLEFSDNPSQYLDTVNKELKYPVFVKPVHLGSSIGLSKVDSKEDLENAIEVALHYDDTALVEEGVNNLIEVTLPVMGNEQPVPALLEQPLIDESGVFDFETKYMNGGKKGKGGAKSGKGEQGAQGYSKIPADLDKELYAKAEAVGVNSYKALGCEGIARIDMLIDSKTKTVYFNEVNPLPGSLYSHNWRKAGYSGVELVEALLGYAKDRHAKQKDNSVAFETSFLNQF